MMALRKFTSMFLIKILIVLPIFVEARSYHGYNSYKDYYRTHTSGKDLKYPVVDFGETASEFYNNNDAKEEVVSRLQGRIQKWRYVTTTTASDKSKRANLESNIIFPEYEPDLQARYGSDNVEVRINSVPVCEGQTFCEETPLYPEELVNKMLAKDSSLMNHANTDVMDTFIAHRMDSNDDDSSELCSSMERIIRPRTGQNVNNDWRFIVQSIKSNFTQAIRIETCGQEGSSCKIIEFPNGYYSMCRQKFIYRQMLALTKNREKTVLDLFRFPTSCCCHVEFSGKIPKR